MGVCSLDDVLFPDVDVRLEAVEFTAGASIVVATACGPPPRCPGCRVRAWRVHSSYTRSLAERSLSGRKLLVRLRVRRFFCDRSQCRRRTFVEQVGGLGERHRRSSLGLKTWLRQVAVELGGRAG
ncbi:transposase family protein [Streptomyces sp. NPDC056367]|uniref:transposase family protein n=1 Tax=Streptomyces sp. NPDC056367 TaxID=3345797 RepID=UPI0035E01B4C